MNQNGTPSGIDATATVAMPGTNNRKPDRTNQASPNRPIQRCCTQAADVHATVATVTATLPARLDVPLPFVRANGTNASTAKKANVSTPRDAITAGSPAAPCRVPGGVRRRNGPTPTNAPAMHAGHEPPRAGRRARDDEGGAGGDTGRLHEAPAEEPAPARQRSCATGPRRKMAGSTITPAHGHEWHQAEEHPPPADQFGDPLRQHRSDHPGNHPCGRQDGEHARPLVDRERPTDRDVADRRHDAGAEALHESPGDQDRHPGGEAAHEQADGEEDQPEQVRRSGADPIGPVAGVDDADHRAEEERRGDPPVPAQTAEVVLDLGQDRRHGERLERHERDDGDEPDLQRPPTRVDVLAVAFDSLRLVPRWSPARRETVRLQPLLNVKPFRIDHRLFRQIGPTGTIFDVLHDEGSGCEDAGDAGRSVLGRIATILDAFDMGEQVLTPAAT